MLASDPQPEPEQPQQPQSGTSKIWCDGCYDLLHFGHANSLRQAKTFGDFLVVGVHSDKDIAAHKGPPVFTFEERCKLVQSIRWVDQVAPSAPYVTTLETLDEHSCKFCCHGDDITVTGSGEDTYKQIKDAGKFQEVKRTVGISTTGLVTRILSRTGEVCSPANKPQSSPWTGLGDNLLLTSEKMAQFSPRKQPKEGDRVVYVAGAFDILHPGHLEYLQKSSELGDFLLVGLYGDEVVRRCKGDIYPILTLQERLMALLACKYVSDVVIGAPYAITKSLIDHFRVDIVADGGETVTEHHPYEDPFAHPKETKKYVRVQVGSELTTELIVQRIIKNRLEYEARNERKEKKEIDLLNELEATKCELQMK